MLFWSWYGTLDLTVYVCPSFVALLRIKRNGTLQAHRLNLNECLGHMLHAFASSQTLNLRWLYIQIPSIVT